MTIRDRLMPAIEKRQEELTKQEELEVTRAAKKLMDLLETEHVEKELRQSLQCGDGSVAEYVIPLDDAEEKALVTSQGVRIRLNALVEQGLSISASPGGLWIELDPDADQGSLDLEF